MKKIMCSVFLISICSFLLKAAAPPRPIAPKPIAGTSPQRQGFLTKITSPVRKFLENRAINKQQAAAAKVEKHSLDNRLNSSTVPMTPNPLYGGRQVTSMPSGQAASRPPVSIEPYKASPQQLANRPLPQTPPPLNTVKVPGTPAGVYDTFAAGKAPAGKPVSTENSVYEVLPPVKSQQLASPNATQYSTIRQEPKVLVAEPAYQNSAVVSSVRPPQPEVNYATLSFTSGSQRKPQVTVPTQYATIQQKPKVPVYQNSAANAVNGIFVGDKPLYSFPDKNKKTSNV